MKISYIAAFLVAAAVGTVVYVKVLNGLFANAARLLGGV